MGCSRFGGLGCRRFDPSGTVPPRIEQSGLEIGVFLRGRLTSFVIPHGHGPIVARGGSQVIAFVWNVYLPVGCRPSGGPYFPGMCRIGENVDFVCLLRNTTFVSGLQRPTERRVFHVDAYGIFYGFRSKPFYFCGYKRLQSP